MQQWTLPYPTYSTRTVQGDGKHSTPLDTPLRTHRICHWAFFASVKRFALHLYSWKDGCLSIPINRLDLRVATLHRVLVTLTKWLFCIDHSNVENTALTLRIFFLMVNTKLVPFCIIVPISQICSFCPNGAMRKGCCHPFGMYSTISSSGGQRSRWTLRAIDSTLPLLVVAGHQGCHHHCASPTSLFVNLWIWNKCFFGAFWVAKVQTGSGKMAVVNLWTLPH